MSYSMYLLLVAATLGSNEIQVEGTDGNDCRAAMEPALERLRQLVERLLEHCVTPAEILRFEQSLQGEVRELARVLEQWALDRLESKEVEALPKHVCFEAGEYTRLNQKTPQNVWTPFGQIRLWRVGYRPTNKSGDATIFPLSMSLGLVQGATPALAERAAWLLGSSGMTQAQTLERLRQDHNVC
jgi:hypothetical protein